MTRTASQPITAESLLDLSQSELHAIARRNGFDPLAFPGKYGAVDLAAALADELNAGHLPAAADDLNDALDDLFNAPVGEVRVEPIRAPADFKPASFDEPCRKCGGSGLYRARSQYGRQCFECKGAGKKTFKTSPEARAKKRASSTHRKAQREAEIAAAKLAQAEAWAAANPEIYAELIAGADRDNQFCRDMLGKLDHWGSLTPGQVAGIRKGMEKRAAAQLAAAARAEAAPIADSAGVDRLKLAFDTAIERARAKGRGLRMPKITICGIVITPAKATSKNPGALYVKTGGTYLGKINGGRFLSSRDCQPDQEKRVLAFIADPKSAAEAYGKETGVCCVCNAPLTNKASVERGIGPICAEKMGW